MTKNVSAILLAAGRSSRFWPLNYTHKSLFKLLGKTILEHLLDELKLIGFKEIVIVTSPRDKKEVSDIINKYDFADMVIGVQEEPRGMWDAILIGANLASNNRYIVLNAHKLNVIDAIKKLKEKKSEDLTLAITKTETPELFGIVKVSGNKIIDVVEKPKRHEAPSNLRIVGVYDFTDKFIDYLENVVHEEESEYKLEYAFSKYAKEKGINYVKINYEPLSIRYPWDIFKYLKFLFNKIDGKKISKDAQVSNWAAIEGPVIIEEEAVISRHTSIIGPVYVGRGAFVGDGSIVRFSDLEANSVVGAHFELARSILEEKATTHSGYMGDSIVGEETRIGAGFVSANVRLDGKTVKCYVKGEKIDTGMRKLGVVIGKGASIGIHVGTMPGVFIGSGAVIGPGKMVYRNVEDSEKLIK